MVAGRVPEVYQAAQANRSAGFSETLRLVGLSVPVAPLRAPGISSSARKRWRS